MARPILILSVAIGGSVVVMPVAAQRGRVTPAGSVSSASVRAHMEMLSSDALQGRRSASRDSWVAATYIASELRRAGVVPAGDAGGYLQSFAMRTSGAAAATESAAVPPRLAWNVVGRVEGTGPSRDEVILLGAHLDHIGVSGTGADQVNNGADDNASGVTAVLGLAEALARGPRPERSIVFAFLDAEESGFLGGEHFLERWPAPLSSIVMSLTFEMVGRPDLSMPPGTLWLTGYERSTLGPELARRGARVVADPYPTFKFFERSDNIVFARRGIVAQALASYGLHRDYHTPGDEMSRIDLDHMVSVIQMLVEPIRGLARSTFRPAWLPGTQPVAPPGR